VESQVEPMKHHLNLPLVIRAISDFLIRTF
jgi:hypothetical protein